MSIRFQRLEAIHLPEHSFMDKEDECYFLREYTSRVGFTFGETNSLISNLKKSMNRRGRSEWRYKEAAIDQCAAEMRAALRKEWLESVTLVPVPPSKARTDPLYDDRMVQVCQRIDVGADVRELVYQEQSLASDHTRGGGSRSQIEDLVAVYRIDEDLLTDPIRHIGIVDDILTTGRHFLAMKQVLTARLPGVPMKGIFIARRVFPQ